MKLVFLCKRRPMGRDLLQRPYGRFFHLPRLLATHGHEVHVALLSYDSSDDEIDMQRDGIHWVSDNLFPFSGWRYVRRVKELLENSHTDWIVGLSDTYYGILAERLGRKYRISSLIDAYDNYEGYVPWCNPLHRLWRGALRRATAISVAGPALAHLAGRDEFQASTLIAPMAVDPIGFVPLAIDDCRRQLGLPTDGKLVGYCGAVYPNRGVDVLFRACDLLADRMPGTRLVLSGRVHKRVKLPPSAIWLGYLPDAQVPILLNSMNVLAVINQPSAFGNYSHPIKLYEAMSCNVPVVATRTPATEWILAYHPELLVKPANPEDLADRLEAAMKGSRVDYGLQPTWESVTSDVERFLAKRRPKPDHG